MQSTSRTQHNSGHEKATGFVSNDFGDTLEELFDTKESTSFYGALQYSV